MTATTITYRSDLWKLLERTEGSAAEIGVAEGRFSREMLLWPVRLRTVYLVDRWAQKISQAGDAANSSAWHQENLTAVRALRDEFPGRVELLRGESVEMAKPVRDASIDLVYIDGDHSLPGVLADIKAWWPKLVPGGVMAFHDYLNPAYGVKHAVELSFVRDAKVAMRSVNVIPEDKDEDAGAWVRK